MDNCEQQEVETDKMEAKKHERPSVYDESSLTDVKRKREEIKNSTVGGF